MDYLRSQAHGALEVVALAVLNQVIDNQDRDEEDDGLEALEVQSHGLTHDPAENNEEGGNEKRNLHGAANCNINGQVHLALVRNDNGGDVFSGVSNDRDQDQTDKRLADVCGLDNRIDAVDKEFGANGHEDSDKDEGDTGSNWRQDLAILALLVSAFLVLDIGEEGVVRVQLEVQVEDVQDEKDDRGAVRQKQDVLLGLVGATVLLVTGDGGVQSRRDDERGGCDSHQRRHGRCDGLVEAALLLADAASQEAAAEHEQDVGEDTAQHAGLNNANLALLERNNADNQLDGIAKGGVHKTTKRLAELCGKLFGRKGEQRSERDNSDEVENEDGGGVPVEGAGKDTNGHEDQQDVDIVADQRRVDEMQEVLGQSGDGRLVGASCANQRGMLSRAILRLRHNRIAERTRAAVATDAVEVALYVFCQVRLAKSAEWLCTIGERLRRETMESVGAAPGSRRNR